MNIKIYQVDAFTDEVFKGNPAGVCILREPADEQWMQNIAMEMNVAETAFIHKQGDSFIVTSRSNSRDYDFVSRFFAPSLGIPEDSVTGSAHCCLGPYWKKRLGKEELIAYQASKRGGMLKVSVSDNEERVHIGGKAVTVFCAEFPGE